jgi:hypothetical protein
MLFRETTVAYCEDHRTQNFNMLKHVVPIITTGFLRVNCQCKSVSPEVITSQNNRKAYDWTNKHMPHEFPKSINILIPQILLYDL